MYQASTAFHNAVATNAPQKALLIFDDAVFTNDDIDVDAGIEMDDYFNTEEDIAIGQALSNELRFSLFNDDRLLNDYTFGDFQALIGVRTDLTRVMGILYDIYIKLGNTGKGIYVNNNTIACTSNTSNPKHYFTNQPSFTVKGLVAMYRNVKSTDKILAVGENNKCMEYTCNNDQTDVNVHYWTGTEITLNAFMKEKVKTWFDKGIWFGKSTEYETIEYKKTNVPYTFDIVKYNYVPLGNFTAKRPNVPDVNVIQFTCHDYMTKFDKDMPTAEELGVTYQTTIRNLFVKMCKYVDVEYASNTFINSTATITKEPEEFGNATMREVLQWIAEAAGSNLRFNRDGQLKFDWLRNTSQALDENDYIEYNPYWYETTTVDKLYNRNTESGADLTVGSGENGYLIQDNPLLKGVS